LPKAVILVAWVRVDDKMARGPKVKRAAAMLGGKLPRRRILSVWLEAMSYCNLNLTDGFVPDYEVADLEDERPAEVFRCMSAGDDTLGAIVERDDQRGGWVFRNYLDYQPSKASIEEKAEIDRKRKAEYRASKIRPRVSQECPNGTDTDGAEVSATTGPTRPEPTRPEPSPIQESVRTERAHSAERDRAERQRYGPPILGAPHEHRSHGWCSERLCVPAGLHAELLQRLGGQHKRDELRAWFGSVINDLADTPVSDNVFDFWRNRFAEWIVPVTTRMPSMPTKDTAGVRLAKVGADYLRGEGITVPAVPSVRPLRQVGGGE